MIYSLLAVIVIYRSNISTNLCQNMEWIWRLDALTQTIKHCSWFFFLCVILLFCFLTLPISRPSELHGSFNFWPFLGSEDKNVLVSLLSSILFLHCSQTLYFQCSIFYYSPMLFSSFLYFFLFYFLQFYDFYFIFIPLIKLIFHA